MYMIPLRRSISCHPARFHGVVSDVFDRFFDRVDPDGRADEWLPAIDVSENDEAFTVIVDVPGLSAADIKLTAEDNTLTITGEKNESSEPDNESRRLTERRSGSFTRTIPLPADIDPENIKAACKDGVLTVTVPKAEQAKVIHVPINGE